MVAPIVLGGFQGAVPKVSRRLLPPNAAQTAINCTFKSGAIAPVRRMANVHTFGSDVGTIYRDGATWLGWVGNVSVARGPVAQDRLYYTGDGVPKLRAGGTVYDLKLPAPTLAPTVTNLSAPGAISEGVLYAYTFVTGFGEESPPSPLSAEIQHSPGVTQRVSAFSAPPASRNVTHIRIYRSQTTLSGATALFFAAEIAVATTQYDYDSLTTPLAEVIPSTDYDPAPDDLEGLVSLPNGIMAAFVGRDLYFSEPYIPHAWPEKYVLTVDFPIVGIVGFGSNLAVLTEGTPYVAQGLSPDSMALEKLEAGLPCVSRRGIVDLGYAALYPSKEGLVLISNGRTDLITKGLFTRDQWAEFSPDTISASRFEQKYLFTRNISDYDTYDGGGASAWAPEDITIDGSGPVLAGSPSEYVIYDFGSPGSSFGEQRLGIIDLEGQAPTFTDTDIALPAATYFDEPTTDLFMLLSDMRTVARWEDRNSTPAAMTWRSKLFTSNIPVSYGAIFIRTEDAIVTGESVSVTVYANGVPVRTITRANVCERLPGDKLATEWEIEIVANVSVVSVIMGLTPEDVMQEVA